MRSGYRKALDDFTSGIENLFRKYKYRKKAKIRLKRMKGGHHCDEEYKKIVLPYWEKFGKKPKKYWYNIFSDREGKVNPRYIPDDYYYGEIVPYYSNPQFRRYAEDKCLHDVLFPNIRRPETVVKNIAGVFYDANMNIIDKEKAIEICLSYNKNFLIKPSIDSGEGRLIHFFEKDKYSKEELVSYMDSLKANYIIQEEVKQHDVLNRLNESSINTIRVVSFLFENQIHILSSILRIGAEGNKIDNVGAGGFACPINNDGNLREKGVNRRAEWVRENNHGIKFIDIKVPSYDRILEIIKKEHKKLAHFKIIGWDFTVSKEGEPIFIEFNSCPGSNQITFGPTFGDLTEKVLTDVYLNKNLKYAQN
ncbi:sugar-transfer associated ATP-grasp domain-containing protein [Lagierella sp.]|uniref:sugar-transfer associated ATP-grasp domain-containing protein n=1 Tax=Lagierella sp. TaxID=2849657 RepID=UPI00263084AE|nr:sugar-transfer associated ATP-grasp domain-containing protein [Lagierella sp.]